jgi:hypothetical protein
MATKTAKQATEKDGLSKREKAIAASAPKASSTSSRSPQVELQVWYTRNAQGNLRQHRRLAPLGTPIEI